MGSLATSPVSRRTELWVYAVLLAGWAVLFFEVLGPVDGLFYRDHGLAFRPLWWSAIEQLKAGQLPTVDMTHPLGLPHEKATTYALFTPTTLIFFLGPFEHTYDLFVSAHFLILGAGVVSVAHALGTRGPEALVAGGIAMFAGPMVSFDNLVIGLQGLAWTPWLWRALIYSIRSPGPGSTAAVGFVLFLAVQGVMPELVLLDLMFLGALLSVERPRWGRKLAFTWLGALVLGGLAATVDVVPLLEGLAGSRRLAGFGYKEQSGWALTPWQLVELLVPCFWTRPSIHFFNIPFITESTMSGPYLPTVYLGGGLGLALAAPAMGRSRALKMAAVTFVVFVVVAMGRHAPLHWLLVQLPGLGSTRFAVKFTLFLVPALVVLTIGALRNLEAKGAAAAAMLLILQMLIAGTFLALIATPDFAAFIQAQAKPFTLTPPHATYADGILDDVLPSMQAGLLHALIASSATLGIVLAIMTRRLPVASAQWVLAILLVFDLAVAGRRSIPAVRTYDTPEAEAAWASVAEARPWLFTSRAPLVPEFELRSPFEDSIFLRRRMGQHGWAVARRFLVVELEGLPVDPMRRAVDRALQRVRPDDSQTDIPPLLGRAGVSLFIFEGDWATPVRFDLPRPDGRTIHVYENSTWAPAEVRHHWLAVTEQEVRAGLDAEQIYPGPVRTDRQPPDDTDCEGGVRSLVREAGFIGLDVNSSCGGFVVVDQPARNGWLASVDGQPAPWTRADAGFLATHVGPGEHRVEFVYRTTTARWMPVSLMALLAMAALAAWSWWRSRSVDP